MDVILKAQLEQETPNTFCNPFSPPSLQLKAASLSTPARACRTGTQQFFPVHHSLLTNLTNLDTKIPALDKVFQN